MSVCEYELDSRYMYEGTCDTSHLYTCTYTHVHVHCMWHVGWLCVAILLYAHSLAPICPSLVETLREHEGWIVNVHMQQYSQERSIVSCRYRTICISRY